MSLLSYDQLVLLVKDEVITNVEPDFINSASIDITLGRTILMESRGNVGAYGEKSMILDLSQRSPMAMQAYEMFPEGYLLRPGEFILAHSEQLFNLPSFISAEYKLKSSMARIGLNHLNAGWCDAGWNGSNLTLELVNTSRHHTIRLHTGDRIGQVVFFQHAPVPVEASYAQRGRYNGDKGVRGCKP